MIKRAFDLSLASVILCFISPFLLIIALFIKVNSPGPVFYRGLRVGQFGRRFRIFKFRTMVVDAERIGASSTPEADPRVTRAGKFLPQYKLHELPQLLNAMNGPMRLLVSRPP